MRYGLNSLPALNSPDFVLRLVFEPSLGAETPKPRFSYLFPGPNAALIQARLRPGMSEDERREAIAMVRQAVSSKAFDLQFGSYVVSGTPVVVDGVAASISDELGVLSGRGDSGDGIDAAAGVPPGRIGCCRWRWRCAPRR